MCFIFSVGRLWWYPRMSFKIAQSNLNSDRALPLCILTLLGMACIQLTYPSTGKVLCKASITHMLSCRFYTILHMVWGSSPCLGSYFLIHYPRCESQLCHHFGPAATCPTFPALQSGLLWRWGSWKYCWPISIVLSLSSVLVANTSEVFKYRAHAAQF